MTHYVYIIPRISGIFTGSRSTAILISESGNALDLRFLTSSENIAPFLVFYIEWWMTARTTLEKVPMGSDSTGTSVEKVSQHWSVSQVRATHSSSECCIQRSRRALMLLRIIVRILRRCDSVHVCRFQDITGDSIQACASRRTQTCLVIQSELLGDIGSGGGH